MSIGRAPRILDAADLRASVYVLLGFGKFSGLWVNFDKTHLVVKLSDLPAVPPKSVVGVTVNNS